MEINEIIKEIGNRKTTGELGKKRVACAHCGSTWIELVGLMLDIERDPKICVFVSVWNRKIVKHAGLDLLNVKNVAPRRYMK